MGIFMHWVSLAALSCLVPSLLPRPGSALGAGASLSSCARWWPTAVHVSSRLPWESSFLAAASAGAWPGEQPSIGRAVGRLEVSCRGEGRVGDHCGAGRSAGSTGCPAAHGKAPLADRAALGLSVWPATAP